MTTANELEHAPANIVAALMIQLGVVDEPDPDNDWPAFFNGEPDAPDDVVTFYDTVGVDQGRDQIAGVLYALRGGQARVRAKVQQDAWTKIDAIRKEMAVMGVRQRVVIDGTPYTVKAFSRIGQPLFIGKEKTVSKRTIYTVNYLVDLEEATS